ncbi:MAG TPA: MFS transporter [Bacillota bacterium]|nr:MFS transporter [Bacillota bacterium]
MNLKLNGFLKWDRILIILAVAGFFYGISQGIQNTVHMNYLSEAQGIGPEQIGFIDGIREIPGLFTAVLALAALYFTESILAALCLVFVSLGLLVYGQATSFSMIIAGTLINSVGFHLYTPLQNSILLRTSGPNERGRRLGTMNSIMAAATVIAALLVGWLVPIIGFRSILMIAAFMSMVGAAVQALSKRTGMAEVKTRGLVFKWKYISYYGLTVLGGSRRQINHTFARMALVVLYGVPVTTMAALMLTANLLSIVMRPLLGRIIDIVGESRALMANYALITLIFLFYAYAPVTPLLYVVFIMDLLLIGMDIAVSTHLDKIAERPDVAPSLAMGSTINHITGILVPMGGGVMWATLGPRSVFLTGAIICALSVVQAWRLPLHQRDATA